MTQPILNSNGAPANPNMLPRLQLFRVRMPEAHFEALITLPVINNKVDLGGVGQQLATLYPDINEFEIIDGKNCWKLGRNNPDAVPGEMPEDAPKKEGSAQQ